MLIDGAGNKHESWRLFTWMIREYEAGTSTTTMGGTQVVYSANRVAVGNHVGNSHERGDFRGPRNYSRRGQTFRPKSPITDCGVFSAINNERLGNAHLSQGPRAGATRGVSG